MAEGSRDDNGGVFLSQELDWRLDHLTGRHNVPGAIDTIHADIRANPSTLTWRDTRDGIFKTGYPPDPGEVIELVLHFKLEMVRFRIQPPPPPRPPGPHPHLVETKPKPFVVYGDCCRYRPVRTPPVAADPAGDSQAAANAVVPAEPAAEPAERKRASPKQQAVEAKLKKRYPEWRTNEELTKLVAVRQIKKIMTDIGLPNSEIDTLRVVLGLKKPRRRRGARGT
jgi:hypothetical protein